MKTALHLKPIPFAEAARIIAEKPAVLREVFDRLLPELRARAFTVTLIEDANVLQTIRDKIAKLPQGAAWDDVQGDVAKALAETPWFSEQAAAVRAQLLIRHHGFMAYAAAQHETLKATEDDFPYWKYVTMGDEAVRDSHRALDGLILPANHPFWDDHYPPWGWGCRCQIVGISRDEAEALNPSKLAPSDPDAQARGWRPIPAQESKLVDGHLIRDNGQTVVVANRSDWKWNPGDLRIPVENLKKRYSPDVWARFEDTARKTHIEEGRDGSITVWDWMHGAPAEAYKERLTKTQRRAFELYSSTEYREWNRKLRSGEPLGEDGAMIEDLSAALKSAPKYRGTVFRRVSFSGREEADLFLQDLPEGAKAKFDGFTSSATETDRTRTFSGDFNVDMEIESKSGVYLGGMSVLPREREVLFDRGTSFIVRKVERLADSVKVYLEESI